MTVFLADGYFKDTRANYSLAASTAPPFASIYPFSLCQRKYRSCFFWRPLPSCQEFRYYYDLRRSNGPFLNTVVGCESCLSISFLHRSFMSSQSSTGLCEGLRPPLPIRSDATARTSRRMLQMSLLQGSQQCFIEHGSMSPIAMSIPISPARLFLGIFTNRLILPISYPSGVTHGRSRTPPTPDSHPSRAPVRRRVHYVARSPPRCSLLGKLAIFLAYAPMHPIPRLLAKLPPSSCQASDHWELGHALPRCPEAWLVPRRLDQE